jgi:hypothetical protein
MVAVLVAVLVAVVVAAVAAAAHRSRASCVPPALHMRPTSGAVAGAGEGGGVRPSDLASCVDPADPVHRTRLAVRGGAQPLGGGHGVPGAQTPAYLPTHPIPPHPIIQGRRGRLDSTIGGAARLGLVRKPPAALITFGRFIDPRGQPNAPPPPPAFLCKSLSTARPLIMYRWIYGNNLSRAAEHLDVAPSLLNY